MVEPLDFEKNIREIESKLEELRHLSRDEAFDIHKEIARLEAKMQNLLHKTYQTLTPWQKVKVARHPNRPHFMNYVDHFIEDFFELCGDRCYGEDQALRGGIGRFCGYSVMVMGHERGHDTESRLRHNFGMPEPEGYRKARRLMEMAERFQLPLITFLDTPGAHPGVGAEERGQAEAIARCIETLAGVKIPVLAVIIGEGGSGGAIALGVANKIYMLEHAVYSVIAPEGCASILWRTADKKTEAALAQRLTAQDLLALEVIDAIIPEPLGGAHRGFHSTISVVQSVLEKGLKELVGLDPAFLAESRQKKFLSMGGKGF